MSKKPRILIVKSCKECPIRKGVESHGPSDSNYWKECGITGKTVEDQDNWEASKWKENSLFPPFCPLKEAK